MKDGTASHTARRVSAHRLGFDRLPADYGDPAADERLTRDVAGGLHVPTGRMHDYLGRRTTFFDRVVVGAIERGVRQIVVGAAGYDGRAYRYAKPGVRWFELDHPATQRDKLARLRRLDVGMAHVRFVAADFTSDPVADRLLEAGLDPAAPTLMLLEGVAVYLDRAVLVALLTQLRSMADVGSHLAISFSVAAKDRAMRGRFSASVAAMGEPVRLAIDFGEAMEILAQTGWRVVSDTELSLPERSREQRGSGLMLAVAAHSAHR